jgi:carbon-monoxide dehydrogenase large subunit
MHDASGVVGAPVRRAEDRRLLTGRGRYVDDLRLEGALHLALVRSVHAHARIRGVDARRVAADLRAFTLADLPELRGALPPPVVPAVALKDYRQSALADGVVRFAGEPIAAVVGPDPYRAADGAAAVTVDYDPLPAVVDTEGAVADGAPLVHAAWGSNVAAAVALEYGAADAALRDADLVVRRRFRFGRMSAVPLEPRAVAARWDAVTGTLHLWASAQMPYNVRQRVAEALGLAPDEVRVTAPDVGGGFGTKGPVYPEELIAAALARRLRRPIRWTDTRSESFVSTAHGADHVHDAALALARDGRFLALVDDFLVDGGAYLPRGAVVANVTATHLPGLYRLGAFRGRGRLVVTHKAPTAPYRGAGRPQATLVVERLIDVAARELGVDPVELRRRNLLAADQMPFDRGMPYRDGVPIVYDSGDYPALLDAAVARSGYATFRERQRAARREGRCLGFGMATYNEGTGIGPHEGATVSVEPGGRVRVTVGAPSQGQGHETVLAQICAERLGVPFEAISVAGGDTTRFPVSSGTYASRIAVVVGTAVAQAADAVRDRAVRLAASALECDPRDVRVAGGRAEVKGAPARGLDLAALAALAQRPDAVRLHGEPGLTATRYFSPSSVTWAAGVHTAVVEVDRETGAVSVLEYHAVHDAGREINPLIVEGQTHGGVVQGLGAALSEGVVYDERGQPLTGTLMEYGLPRADAVPPIQVAARDSPSPLNLLGVKGTGEGSAGPPPAAVANAVADALGIEVDEVPIARERVSRQPERDGVGDHSSPTYTPPVDRPGIRALAPGDRDAALAVINRAARWYRDFLPPEDVHDPEMTPEQWEAETRRLTWYGVFDGSVLVAVGGLEHVRDAALLRHGYVLPEYQRRGVGTVLREHLEHHVRDVDRIIVGTYAGNYKARGALEKAGYRLSADSEAVLRAYYAIPEDRLTSSVTYEKPLRSPGR